MAEVPRQVKVTLTADVHAYVRAMRRVRRRIRSRTWWAQYGKTLTAALLAAGICTLGVLAYRKG